MQQLFDYFQKNPITIKQIRLYLKNKENLKLQLLQQYNSYKDRFSFLLYVKYFLLNLLDKKCLNCGRLLNNEQIRKNSDYCSKDCSNKSPIVKQKRHETFIQKYGVENISQLQQIKKKKKKKSIQKYGVEHPLKSEVVLTKLKKTNLQRYGCQYVLSNQEIKNKILNTVRHKFNCNNVSQSDEIRQKIKKTNLERYGCDCSLNNKQIRQKIKKTNLQRYGNENYLNSEIGKERIKSIFLQNYGVQKLFQNQQIRQKIKKTNLEKYGSENYFSSDQFLKSQLIDNYFHFVSICKQFVVPLFDQKSYCGFNNNIKYKWQCVKCGNQWQQHIHLSNIDGKSTYIPRCLKCYPYISGFSELEKQFVQFVKQNICLNILQHNRNIIKPYQLDIYIPQKKIAIQFNGLYWHSQQFKDKNYHLNKTELCLQKEISLIHVFEDQWLYKQEIVKDRIKNILGIYDNRIFARKCQVKEIDSKICNQFLDENHIQRQDNSKIKLGLFFENQLVSVMTFRKLMFNKKYEYQLVRFASKLNTQVIGGASKLLKYFERNYNPKSLISYADRRYSNGKLYYALDFQFLNNSEPNYFWIKNQQKYTRYQCQKQKLKELLKQNFDNQLTEDQNMYLNGYNKIYDCGNMVFIKNY